jgi:hypothetical protein
MVDHRDNLIDLNALFHPASVYDHPRDVVGNAALPVAEKRAILVGVGCGRGRVPTRRGCALPLGRGAHGGPHQCRGHKRLPEKADAGRRCQTILA